MGNLQQAAQPELDIIVAIPVLILNVLWPGLGTIFAGYNAVENGTGLKYPDRNKCFLVGIL